MTYLRFLASLRPLLALSVPLLPAVVGCESSVNEKIALAQLAQSCLVNSDCSEPFVCAFKACHAECESSRDCDAGARCVSAAHPYKVCQLEQERVCKITADCPTGLVCGIDGECRDQCQADSQCVENQLCVSGTCADKDELDGSGQLVPLDGKSFGTEGSPCVYVSDCADALLCRGQACLPECKADKDCPLHQTCKDTRCVDDGSQPNSCTYHSECDTERGQRCLGGSCLCVCLEDRDCPAGQLCDGCGCNPDPKQSSCIYNSDCKTPGQICKDRACACECKTDRDCQAGSTCDGCGCVEADQQVDGIIRGNLFVDSTLQLANLRGVTEIHGGLTISSAALTDVGDTFDQLTLVDGQLQVTNSYNLLKVSFPKLTQATGVNISYVGAKTVELPLLKKALVNINNLQKMTLLSIASLETGELTLSQLPLLTKVDLPALKTVNLLQLSEVPLVSELLLPSLTTVASTIQINSGAASALAMLSAPNLGSIGEPPAVGTVTIDNTQLSSLTSFGTQDLDSPVRSLQLTRNPLLSDCEVQVFASHFPDLLYPSYSDNLTCNGVCNGTTCSPTN